jgi:prephenate dehydrogenase
MTVGIIGLGLIGGSMAKAYKENSGATVLAADRDSTIVEYARLQGAVDGELTADTIPSCDLILIALYPRAAMEYLKNTAHLIAKEALVIDLCGTKRTICEAGFALAEQYGFTFVGGHPMAGLHHSGFKYARGNLFHGASMVLVPPTFDDIFLLDRVKKALAPVGFGRMTVTTADQHDEMIAFTSQLAHVVSNAYVKSPTARSHKGFSAGSYKDLTRVARLNEEMWSELFVENKEHLVSELNALIASLTEYRDAIRDGNTDATRSLLKDGREAKESIDGK